MSLAASSPSRLSFLLSCALYFLSFTTSARADLNNDTSPTFFFHSVRAACPRRPQLLSNVPAAEAGAPCPHNTL